MSEKREETPTIPNINPQYNPDGNRAHMQDLQSLHGLKQIAPKPSPAKIAEEGPQADRGGMARGADE